METPHFSVERMSFLFVFSIFISIAAIIHGIYMDLNITPIKRLTLERFILTLLVIFSAILFLEWIFDINNKKKFDELERRLRKKK